MLGMCWHASWKVFIWDCVTSYVWCHLHVTPSQVNKMKTIISDKIIQLSTHTPWPAQLDQEHIFSQHTQDQDGPHHTPPSGLSQDGFLLDEETLAKSRIGVLAATFGQVPTSALPQDSSPLVESEYRSRLLRCDLSHDLCHTYNIFYLFSWFFSSRIICAHMLI